MIANFRREEAFKEEDAFDRMEYILDINLSGKAIGWPSEGPGGHGDESEVFYDDVTVIFDPLQCLINMNINNTPRFLTWNNFT